MKKSYDLGSLSPVTKAFMAGSFSGTCSTVLLQPLDLVKTKMQKNPARRTSVVHITRDILGTEGVSGLWRGLKPALARTVPGVGLYFASLHGIKSTFKMEQSPLVSVVTGASARAVAGMIMMPFTILKVRWEAGLAGAERNLLSDFLALGRKEGLGGFVKGAVPTLARDAPYSGLYLLFYDTLKSNVMHRGQELSLSPTSLHFCCGVLAGCLASLVTQPADVVKTSMQLQAGGGGVQGRGQGQGLRAAAASIYRAQGLGGFLVGLGPRMARRAIMAALAWTVYERAMVNMGFKNNKK